MTAAPAQQTLEEKLQHNMKLYYFSIANELPLWWDEFCGSRAPSGKPLFKGASQLVATKAKSIKQTEFLNWLLGPDRIGEEDENYTEYRFAGRPQDWKARRDTGGGWWSDRQLRSREKRVCQGITAFEQSGELGKIMFIPAALRAERMEEEFLQNFGPLYRDDLTEQQNQDRVAYVLTVLPKFASYKQMLNDAYLRSHGINLDQPDALQIMINQLAVVAGGRSSLGPAAEKVDRQDKILLEMMRDAMIKHNTVEGKFPDKIEQKIIDVEKQLEVEPSKEPIQ